MWTQKEIAEKIIEKEVDYILVLKENQKTLYGNVKLYLDEIKKEKEALSSQNYARTVEKGHGRTEIRKCIISEEINWLDNKEDWKKINGIGAIRKD